MNNKSSYKTLVVGIVGAVSLYLSQTLGTGEPLNWSAIIQACVALAFGVVAKDFNVSGGGTGPGSR